VRRVAAQPPALAQRVVDQLEVALSEVAHTAVEQLGAAAGRAFGEVHRFEQQRGVATCSGIDGCAESSGAAADHNHIPYATSANAVD
jgi:hypothetical protein